MAFVGEVRFNPRAREGRDMARATPSSSRRVSIHAPARGATILVTDHDDVIHVSIHAPARGATCELGLRRAQGHVSIHAPARGATARSMNSRGTPRRFNPRAREGRDRAAVANVESATVGFNPRAREGRDLRRHVRYSVLNCFNPRAREGRDDLDERAAARVVEFQSTRPRGARLVASAPE
ncbi:hypothetical protein GTA08_BOTSDO14204 [Botryosphaeria dothidea]|uniref:Uncharacterized protein n=1 Tax=Botryosphaeria dothidea TaxID=55169 RepID=A0A8H4N0X4_9PEZI|nr:hypothetical protein GTA08_BOTSDO14204 [Botryosphaeria dothidea]